MKTDLADTIERLWEGGSISSAQRDGLIEMAMLMLAHDMVMPSDVWTVTHQPDGSVTLRSNRGRVFGTAAIGHPITPGREYEHLPTSNEWSSDHEA